MKSSGAVATVCALLAFAVCPSAVAGPFPAARIGKPAMEGRGPDVDADGDEARLEAEGAGYDLFLSGFCILSDRLAAIVAEGSGSWKPGTAKALSDEIGSYVEEERSALRIALEPPAEIAVEVSMRTGSRDGRRQELESQNNAVRKVLLKSVEDLSRVFAAGRAKPADERGARSALAAFGTAMQDYPSCRQ